MALKAKNVNHKIIDITPGIGQVTVFRLSGQRKVPVLVDEENIIFDSSEIIEYIDKKYLLPKLIPNDPKLSAQAHLIENWADTTLAKACRAELIKAASIDTELRMALLPNEIPSTMKKLTSSMSFEVINKFTNFINHESSSKLLTNLENISKLLKDSKWIIGDSMSIADIAIAAQLSLIKFPSSSGIPLVGKGSKDFNNHPKLISLFNWRDQFDISVMGANPGLL